MIKSFWRRLGLFRRAEFMSARDMLQRAGGLSVLFLLAHLAGLREFTSVLNGTVGSTAVNVKLGTFLAAVYILLFLASVILVPVLVLAALILMVWQRCVRKEENFSGPRT
jgi:hypothetical protein